MSLNTIDTILQSQFPTLMVPIHETWNPLNTVGHRFLMASNGIWLEMKRAWLYARVLLASQTSVPMPYGGLEQCVTIAQVPRLLLQSFQEYAQSKLPNECAARIILNTSTQQMRLQLLESNDVGTGHINYKLDSLPSEEVTVLDIHSHGFHPVYFSGPASIPQTDDADDIGETKIAGVIGFMKNQKGEVVPSEALFRLCLNGLFLTLQFKRDYSFIQFYL